MIGDVFKPSASKLGLSGSDYRLIRSKGWTSNGIWMIKTDLEPDYIKRLKENNTTADPGKILDKSDGAIYKLEVKNELTTGQFKTVLVKLALTDESNVERAYFESWVNVYFLSLFLNLVAWRRVSFWTQGPLEQIFVKSNDEIIGVIAPVRID